MFFVAIIPLAFSLSRHGGDFLFNRDKKIIFSIFFLGAALGVFRFHLADTPAPEVFESRVNQEVSLSGQVVDEPDARENNLKLTVLVLEGGQKTEILLSADINGGYKYGDEISFSGVLEKPENFKTDQGKIFDYVNYLRKDGILYLMKYPKIEIVSHGGNIIKRALFSAKEKFLDKIGLIIPNPESLLMGGLILGEKSAFSQDLRQSFVNTGTIHIIALSGYNVTIVAEWIMKILSFLPKNFSIGAGVLSIFLFIIMTGGASTAVRAGIMAALALLARATRRDYDIGRALVLAGALMILLDPLILAFDVSFQLSFLATIAVIYISPKVEKYFLWIKWKWFRDIVSITISAYIFVMPFILYKMGNLSLVALPANIAVLPFIPLTMILGFVTGFVGLASSLLAFVPGQISYFFLHYELAAIGFFSRFSFSSISLPSFPLLLTVLIYIFFFYKLFGWNTNQKENKPARNASQSDAGGEQEKTQPPLFLELKKFKHKFIAVGLMLGVVGFGSLYYFHYKSNLSAVNKLQALLIDIPVKPLALDPRTKLDGCIINGPLPDHECSPGAVFPDATPEQICVSGYTKTVRNVSISLKRKVYREYGIPYPPKTGSYEADHIIPLELGGSNDIANLFPEAAEPQPGFKEKDVVENYLHQEVCAYHVALTVAQQQIATDWLAVYDNLSPEEILALKQKYRSWAGN